MSTPNQWEDPSADLAKMKILIIDDEPVNVALLEEILVEAGYTRFESILDSKLALQIYKTFLPDLVLLDLMMPPPDGLPFWNRSVPMLAIHFCRS
jgi:putative two-component system response regulator